MDELPVKSSNKRNPILLFTGGCLGILYLALCVLASIAGYKQVVTSTAPSPTPTITPIPQMLVHRPSDPSNVIHEDFSSNKRHWRLYYSNGKLELINGKLILQSNLQDSYTIGTSSYVAPKAKRYYAQADFSTDIQTPHSYGLVFGSDRSKETFYFFEIQPNGKRFHLSKFDSGQWTELVPSTEAELSPFPHINTLSVYFDQGKMELYINGNQVAEYSDQDFFPSSDVGMFMSDRGYRLLVDDFFIYSEK
jgi:hypothetical protein